MSQVASRDDVDARARELGFSGVIDIDGTALGYGEADRAHHVPVTPDTRLGLASGSKAMTALVIMSLVEEDLVSLQATARTFLGDDLPLVDDAVTIEHLLTHRSGIGDYLDEDELEINDYVLKRPVHELDHTEAFVPLLDGHPQKFAPGSAFAYCNGGFVVLALIAERITGRSYHDLVRERVLVPAGMTRADFLRSDALPGDVALGYLDDGRTNLLHLPVLATGDGGLHATVGDLRAFWSSFFAGLIVSPTSVASMTQVVSDVPQEMARYGRGFWVDQTGPQIFLTGYDAGVSFWSQHDPRTSATTTLISNTSEGVWPLRRLFLGSDSR